MFMSNNVLKLVVPAFVLVVGSWITIGSRIVHIPEGWSQSWRNAAKKWAIGLLNTPESSCHIQYSTYHQSTGSAPHFRQENYPGCKPSLCTQLELEEVQKHPANHSTHGTLHYSVNKQNIGPKSSRIICLESLRLKRVRFLSVY
jgi:hypothetical protein